MVKAAGQKAIAPQWVRDGVGIGAVKQIRHEWPRRGDPLAGRIRDRRIHTIGDIGKIQSLLSLERKNRNTYNDQNETSFREQIG